MNQTAAMSFPAFEPPLEFFSPGSCFAVVALCVENRQARSQFVQAVQATFLHLFWRIAPGSPKCTSLASMGNWSNKNTDVLQLPASFMDACSGEPSPAFMNPNLCQAFPSYDQVYEHSFPVFAVKKQLIRLGNFPCTL